MNALQTATEALEAIALAGMSGSGQESEEGLRDWHARRAWEFISTAARALNDVRNAGFAAAEAKAAGSGVQLAASRARRAYIAGPMTGLPEFNFPAFNAKAAELRAQGWHIENPAEHGVVEGATWADYLHYDLTRLATCEAMFLLAGWSDSNGAKLEVSIARALGMRIHLAEGAEPIGILCYPATQAGALQAVTDEQILHLWDGHVGEPCEKYPLKKADALHFARAVLALAPPQAEKMQAVGARVLEESATSIHATLYAPVLKEFCLEASREDEGRNWYIEMTDESGYHTYDGYWRDSDRKTCAEVLTEAANGSLLHEIAPLPADAIPLPATQPNAAPAAEVVAQGDGWNDCFSPTQRETNPTQADLASRYLWLRDDSGADLRSLLGVGDLTSLDAFIDHRLEKSVPLAAPGAATDAREQEGESGDRPRGPRIEHLCRAICSITGARADQVLDIENGVPTKLSWHRYDLQAAKLLRELDALASRSEAPEARPNAAGQEKVHTTCRMDDGRCGVCGGDWSVCGCEGMLRRSAATPQPDNTPLETGEGDAL